MSRRFGRQQKRKMRAEVAKLQRYVDYWETEARELTTMVRTLRTEAATMRNALELTANVLGPNFVGLPVAEMNVSHIDRRFSMFPYERAIDFGVMASNADLAHALTYSVIELDTHKPSVELDRLRAMMHVRLVTPSGEDAYAVNMNHFASVPRGSLVHHLAQEFAALFANRIHQPPQSKRAQR